MLRTPDPKRTIRIAFGEAAATYDAAAHIQRRIADRLIAHASLPAEGCLLDAGCGTGYGWRQLVQRAPAMQVVALDHAVAMSTRNTPHGLCGDLEALPLADASIDHYWSSLAWQWVDAGRAAHEAARVLRSGARLDVATLGPQTLHELRHAFTGVDARAHVRTFGDLAGYEKALRAAGFIDIDIRRETFIDHAGDLRALLRSLRDVGANTVDGRSRTALNRAAWRAIESRYETMRDEHGLPASYEALFLFARKTP
ncbi:methyltransferase domain-containing protein [Uliginosibacterium sp. sgz301328]|uniref:methyltransferase domain-containing protein n=1 Tax=Uliginosibacterium sp. sgz301328 TaxID=3243764 RepID=UPI00359E2C92